MKNKSKTKLDTIVDTYEELAAEYRALGDQKLIDLFDSFIPFIQTAKANPQVKRSAIVAGCEQGLRETPLLLTNFKLSEDIQGVALKIFYRVVEIHMPVFFEKERQKREMIVRRGKIKGESEWHLLRNRVDEIEGDAAHEVELLALYKMLDDYESAAYE
ncbi:hypothetical protein BCF11_4235 [Collimonas sp. PA-H2]|uniref:hypothetical protein n=1 Tax=Collimonas sp. PA-H2 TaxID=1881062 RepID=UPI000BF9055B|nr:hypothetical protein [Collimonas sp. PA-H2]PFH11777.1 hypothetical protein BCF11_4235 [Collimonas sp. PA-H2]